MILSAVIARLRSAAMPPLRLVDGAAEFAALDAPPALLPAAYVIPLDTTAAPNGLAAGGFRQRVQEGFGVVLLHRNLRDPQGARAALDLADGVIPAVRAALMGWVPAPGWDQVELRAAGLTDMDEGVLAWREEFVTATHLRTG